MSDLLRLAADWAIVLRERAAEAEALRRLPDSTAAELRLSPLLRICQPARFGGLEQDWTALCETSIELARGDASQAWVANIFAEHAYMVSLFPDAAQREVFGARGDAFIAASLLPAGNRAAAVEGGYRLDGKWSFASGVHHADWVIIGEVVAAESGPAEHHFFLVPARDVRIDDDWHTLGMVGTGSASVVLRQVFVPGHRAVANREVAAGAAPGAAVNGAPLYRMPIAGFAQSALAAVPVGIAFGMVDDFARMLRAKPAASQVLQEALSDAAAAAQAAKLLVLEVVRDNMRRLAAGAALGEAELARTLRDGAYAVKLAKHAALRLMEATGAHGLYLDRPMQRAFRDIVAAANHGSLGWERGALRYAQWALKG
jgi:alkylation response protein AidB-like acyl-CoA dehydrogenase